MGEGWISDELDLRAFIPTKRMGFAFDIGLVLVTLVYLGVYISNGMTWLIVCAFACFAMLAVSFALVLKGPDMRYIAVNIVEIIFFMVANVVFLGTNYGFQLYVFGFLTSAMLLSLSAGGRGKVLMPTKVIIALLMAFYTAVTLWFGNNTPLYSFKNPAMIDLVFLINSFTTMATIILFTGTYMAMAVSLASRLSNVAMHDALTGLLNRHGFYPTVAATFNHCGRDRGTCCLAMLDIDHFKDINDTYGHDGGDAVLKHLAELFGHYMKLWPGLQVARWGGEEFLLLYVSDKPIDVREHGPFESLRDAVESTSVSFEGNDIHWTVTIGVADCTEGNTPDDIISLSDKRLYEGKQGGRNRVVYGHVAQA